MAGAAEEGVALPGVPGPAGCGMVCAGPDIQGDAQGGVSLSERFSGSLLVPSAVGGNPARLLPLCRA